MGVCVCVAQAAAVMGALATDCFRLACPPSLPSFLQVFGDGDSVEALCRKRGLGVIHGGANALRFTPWYHITAPEVNNNHAHNYPLATED